jgi:PD-(D/E)XK nuclease superfamily
MLSLTPTKLRDFLACPQLYKLRHVARVDANTNLVALSFGRSLHAALEEFHGGTNGDGRAVLTDPVRLLQGH